MICFDPVQAGVYALAIVGALTILFVVGAIARAGAGHPPTADEVDEDSEDGDRA